MAVAETHEYRIQSGRSRVLLQTRVLSGFSAAARPTKGVLGRSRSEGLATYDGTVRPSGRAKGSLEKE